jgi:hypothetical protein
MITTSLAFSSVTGGLLMARYRADIIDSDGHFKNAIYLELADDNSAIETAKRLVNDHSVEVWDGHRKMATFQGGETEGAVPVVAGGPASLSGDPAS